MHLAGNIDIQHGLVGGLMLGASSSALMYLTGQITGLSGICEGLFSASGKDWHWSYMAGLFSSGYFISTYMPEAFGSAPTNLSSITIVTAGVLTGFGTRLSGGCTSGHGLCGLSRLSPRSLVAVLTFMTTGGIAAYVTRLPEVSAFLQTSNDQSTAQLFDYSLQVLVPTIIAIGSGILISRSVKASKDSKALKGKESATEKQPAPAAKKRSTLLMHLVSAVSGLAFGCGLGISGMCNPERVLRFLDFSGAEGWDPSLMAVLGSGVLLTLINFHSFNYCNTNALIECSPGDEVCLARKLHLGTAAPNMVITPRLVLGAALFGLGWGTAGMCPGPAIVSLGATIGAAGKMVPSMVMGMVLQEALMG